MINLTKITLLLISLLSITFFSCSDDEEDDNENSVVCNAISELCENEWELVKVSGGLAGIDDDIEKGDIQWEVEGTMLEVETYNACSALYCGPEEGEYDLSIINANGKNYLVIDGQEFGEIMINNNTMIVDQNSNSNASVSDGFILTFEIEE